MTDPQQQTTRFTPEEIRELVESGDMTQDDLRFLHPQDKKVAVAMLISSGQVEMQGGPVMPPGVGGVLKAGASKVAGAMPTIIPGAARAAITAAGTKAGHPFVANTVGRVASDKLKKMFGSGSTPAPKPAGPPVPAQFTGTGAQGAAQGRTVMSTGATPTGFSISRPGASSTVPAGVQRQRPILGSSSLDDEIAERVKGGVQNDFQLGKRVTFEKPGFANSAYPGNVTTESTTDEIIEMILGLSREGQTPMKWADKANRNSVDRLKRQVQRRTPR